MSNAKGDRWERNYVNALAATDRERDRDDYERVGVGDFAFVEHFTALRLPASGAGRKDDLPDLHVWLTSPGEGLVEQFAVEAKAGADRVRLSNDEVDALRRYADDTGSTPLVFVHIDYTGDFVVPIDELHTTSKGYTFTEYRDVDDALAFGDWVERPTTTV